MSASHDEARVNGLPVDTGRDDAARVASRIGLSWKIALAVLVSLVAVEALILVPSYFRLERDLLLRQEAVGRATIVATFRTQSHASTRDLVTFGRLLVRDKAIAGGTFYTHANQKIVGFGTEPDIVPMATKSTDDISRTPDGRWLDVVWRGADTRLPWTIAARMDTSWISGELDRFALINIGLVALISVFVCGATMVLLRTILLRRIGVLHGWLSRLNFDTDAPAENFPRSLTNDEFDQMARTLQLQVDRAKANFREIRREREDVNHANLRLEALIAERTKDLRAAKAVADLSNHAKTEFLAHMSHELRTPLNAIVGFSRILKDETFGPLGHRKYFEYVRDIAKSGEDLAIIVDDILDVSDLQLGGLNLLDNTVDLEKLVEDCINALQVRADLHLVALRMVRGRPLPRLRADERRIRQILQKLLVNAIKFSPQGGQVVVRTDVAHDGAIIVVVEDNGSGIPPEEIPRVLEAFGQVRKSIEISHEGAGLGLFIAKSLVELHEGTFVLESDVGKGTKVTMRFPISRSLAFA
ncbi:MAG: hypothetical protein COW30_14740 [Rhodospirillales bacterium CG15_BIG_FIL_POST_REV_8_21_14_020_66_15]|nr:MAG: hypothetical protein COW30_14740 [Rhodospirillales bacterium CG15_BIG_FIL_POST_REV_8_21_14_020_66_15]